MRSGGVSRGWLVEDSPAPLAVACSPSVCLGAGALGARSPAVREVHCALATQACPLETVSSPHPPARSSRPHSLQPLGTWSSPSSRRWARAPRGPSALPRAQPVAPPSPGVPRPWRPHAPRSVPAACRGRCGLCARGPGRPHLPARRPPAAWPLAGSPPRRGMGREERRGVGDRHSLREHSYGRRQTAAAGGSPLRRREAGHLPRRPEHCTPSPEAAGRSGD